MFVRDQQYCSILKGTLGMKTERIVKSLLEMLDLDASEFVRLMVRVPLIFYNFLNYFVSQYRCNVFSILYMSQTLPFMFSISISLSTDFANDCSTQYSGQKSCPCTQGQGERRGYTCIVSSNRFTLNSIYTLDIFHILVLIF